MGRGGSPELRKLSRVGVNRPYLSIRVIRGFPPPPKKFRFLLTEPLHFWQKGYQGPEMISQGRTQRRPKQSNNKRKIKIMKNRSSFTIFTTIFSVLACFGLAFGAGNPESPDPTPFPVNSNTADGFRALENSDNAFNSAFGWFSLFTNTDAFFNSGFGAGTLFFNDGADNTAVGTAAMFFNTSGHDNTAVGINALRDNTIGFDNNAVGSFALFSNVDGNFNNAHGRDALTALAGSGPSFSGADNNAFGDLALDSLVDGYGNTAVGDFAGDGLGTGQRNTYIGSDIFVGDENDTIRIGNPLSTRCFVAGILTNPIPSGPGTPLVAIDLVTGQLGVTTDFAANKVAEQEKKIEEQQASISQLKSEMQTMVAQLKEQGAQIQRVSAQLEVSKPAPRVVTNKP